MKCMLLLAGCQSLKWSHGARRSTDVSRVDIFQDYAAVSGRGDWFSLPYNCIPEEPCKVFTRKRRGTVWLHGVRLVVVVAPELKGTPGLFLFSSIREIIDSSTLQRTLIFFTNIHISFQTGWHSINLRSYHLTSILCAGLNLNYSEARAFCDSIPSRAEKEKKKWVDLWRTKIKVISPCRTDIWQPGDS